MKDWLVMLRGGIRGRGMSILIPVVFLVFTVLIPVLAEDSPPDAQKMVEKSFNYMRGDASVSELEMTIHRADWERTMSIKAWTKGEKESFFVITVPPKDKGNATLKKNREMWMFNPKVNRIIKLPPSMMSQAWQGSDFSNNDLSRTDSIKIDYTHSIESEEEQDGKKVYTIKSIPKEGAPVIWGMQKLKIREDGIMLMEEYFDEEMKPVKKLTMSDIEMLGGKLYPKIWKMEKSNESDEYTILQYTHLEFRDSLPARYFTQSNLRNPGR